jgi:hypothetical protein
LQSEKANEIRLLTWNAVSLLNRVPTNVIFDYRADITAVQKLR